MNTTQELPTTALKSLWATAQTEKTQFISNVDQAERAFRKTHPHINARILWLDELLLGIEVRRGKTRTTLYASGLETGTQHHAKQVHH